MEKKDSPSENLIDNAVSSDICASASDACNSNPFKFNAQAEEFVPMAHSMVGSHPYSGCFYPCYLGVADWFPIGNHDDLDSHLANDTSIDHCDNCSPKIGAPVDDRISKIVKQAEYQFSDMSLLANESMARHVSKDPNGYVPISVIASTKKMKSISNNAKEIAQALRGSTKLIVNSDGTKVKRKTPFTDKGREEIMSRTVVIENLPEDHSHQNLEKICNAVGSVKTIRICHPKEPSSSRPKSEFLVSNKLHALVEFESSAIAEKAVEKLTDERDWRKGLRVRLLLRCSPKSVLKGRKSEFDGIFDDDDAEEESVEPIDSPLSDDVVTPSEKKQWSKSRSKSKSRGKGLSPQTSLNKGPRMPDGTKGFTMGRGKPTQSTHA